MASGVHCCHGVCIVGHYCSRFALSVSQDKHLDTALWMFRGGLAISSLHMDNSEFSFKKKPIFRYNSQSRINVISDYPPQQYDQVDHDLDHHQFYSKYKGVLKDKDELPDEVLDDLDFEYNYDDKIRAPRVSLINPTFKSEASNDKDPKDPSQLEMQPENRNYVAGETARQYRPASFDLSKPTRQYSQSTESKPSVSKLRELKLKLHNEQKINYVPPVLRPTLVGIQSQSQTDVMTTSDAASGRSSASRSRSSQASESTEQPSIDIPLTPVFSNSSSSSKGVEPSHSHWKPNSSSFMCAGCNAQFSLVRRKHHCRHCGEIFCYQCVHNRANLNLLAKFEKPGLHNIKHGSPETDASKKNSYCKFSKVCEKCFKDWLIFLQNDNDHELDAPLENIAQEQVLNRDRMNSQSSKTGVPNDWNWSSF
ncbi:hypothetical protein OGAPHI_006601 [Ogataea philodendri]|uniref:FYVE-type domain-containing protein n=1 Tax=Ogataea philodendri TaxID=1378263 RepID=A0A9P8NXE6_9ASCO|nr:uncharacterized protein OGAPHI_006601 [Ogataea philodendri]KAH3661194.1 hypothetical protein OGAPHI_006601 [Ogataea philodendri]